MSEFITDKPLLFFDLETTGLDTAKDRIIQIAWCIVEKGEIIDRVEMLINPLIPIEAGASAVHGIYAEDIETMPSFAYIYPIVRRAFTACAWAGYNIINFDIPLLLNETKRCGRTLPLPDHIIDCFLLFKKQYPHTLEGALKQYCGKPHLAAHDALADVMGTVDVFNKQIEDENTPNDIEALCTHLKRDNQLDLAGKIKSINGVPCLTFGKHKNKPITSIAQSYFEWAYKNNVFLDDAWDIIKKELGY